MHSQSSTPCACGCGQSAPPGYSFVKQHHQNFGDPERYFWTHIDKTGDCWLWTGVRDGQGYGRIRLIALERHYRTHVYSWILHNGPIPKGLLVCHKCDVPACCNPDHLFLGTHHDNAMDMVAKGRNRQPQGMNHYGAKLTDEQVRQIRHDVPTGISQSELGRRYGVTVGTINSIVLNKTWKHLL